MMPSLSGMQLLQSVRASIDEDLKGIPFVLLSSFAKANNKLQEFQIKTPDGSLVDILIKPVNTALALRKIQILSNSRVSATGEVTSLSPGTKKKSKPKTPLLPHKEYSPRKDSSLEHSRTVKSQPDIAGAARDRLVSFSHTDSELNEKDSSKRKPKPASTTGSALGDTLKQQRSSGHARRASEGKLTSSTPFLDTVFSGGVTDGNSKSEREGKLGPNWDDLGPSDNEHSSIKHSGRRRTITKKKPEKGVK